MNNPFNTDIKAGDFVMRHDDGTVFRYLRTGKLYLVTHVENDGTVQLLGIYHRYPARRFKVVPLSEGI